MGIHGTATWVMAHDGATGWRVGEETDGLRNMFTMMNTARLMVGMQGLAVATAAQARAAEHAKTGRPGRAVAGPADPILVHPDVRRLLMEQRAFVEGGRALLAWTAMVLDTATPHADPGVRARAKGLAALLTPVVKAHLTEEGFRMESLAQQVFGGAGYTVDTGVEQLVRDVRITTVYEATTGVRALDLVGRKLAMAQGAAVRGFIAEVTHKIDAVSGRLALAEPVGVPLEAAVADLQAALGFFMKKGLKAPEEALAGATDFLHFFGHVARGLVWARMAQAAADALGAGAEDRGIYEAKLATARFYMARVLPETGLRRWRIESGSTPVMSLPADAF